MLFYLCDIPKNVLEFDRIHGLVMERYDCYTSKAEEYDISPDSDVLGHFIMCLVASKSPLLHEIVLRGETQLFINKLTELNGDEIMDELNCAVRFLSSLNEIEGRPSLNSKLEQHGILVKNILRTIEYKGEHVFNCDHSSVCHKYEIIIPFIFPLSLIAERKVDLVQGKAKVPCGLWIDLLLEIFKIFLEFEIRFLNEFHLLQCLIYESEDERLKGIVEKVMKSMTGMTTPANEDLTADDIDNEIQCFPPCMLNLHKILRQTHRLSYYSRYQYTLFLKDIGLPAKENVLFWKNEYSKPHNSSSCTHNWEENVSRYEYQILHMYGLIGTTTLKTSHSCEKFVEKLTLRMDGGCPFVHFTKDTLVESFLKDFNGGDIEDILSDKERNRPLRACAIYFLKKYGFNQNDVNAGVTEMISPLHYYNIAKGCRGLNDGRKM